MITNLCFLPHRECCSHHERKINRIPLASFFLLAIFTCYILSLPNCDGWLNGFEVTKMLKLRAFLNRFILSSLPNLRNLLPDRLLKNIFNYLCKNMWDWPRPYAMIKNCLSQLTDKFETRNINIHSYLAISSELSCLENCVFFKYLEWKIKTEHLNFIF